MDRKYDFASIIAADLHASEQAADRQLAQLGVTLTDITTGRFHAGFAAGPGQRGLDHLAEAIAFGVAARRSLVAAHDSFARDARRLKLRWTAPDVTTSGPLEKLPGGDTPEVPKPTGRLAEAFG